MLPMCLPMAASVTTSARAIAAFAHAGHVDLGQLVDYHRNHR
jgi:hypothetical protein